MTTITASYTVLPNESTPKARMWLSDSDQVSPWTHVPSIYIYELDQKKHGNINIIERLRESLSKILVYYYPVAGRLSWIEGGRLELDCNAKGVKLVEAESTRKMSDYGDFSPKYPIKELSPKVDYDHQPIQDMPLLLVQLTRFQGEKQGLAIGIAMSHSLGDGIACIRFINSWAKMGRGEPLGPDEMYPHLDRTILKPSSPLTPPRFEHRELKPWAFPLILGCSDSLIERNKETTVEVFKLTPEHVEKLKRKANDENNNNEYESRSGRPYSRYEAIAAHIWRCASKARQLDPLQPTIVRVSADVRNRLNPTLAQNYFGNALAPTVTPICHVGDIISNPLSYAAQKIRAAIGMLTNDYIRSQYDFIRGQEQLDGIRNVNNNQLQGQKRDSVFYGNPNLTIGTWVGMPVYDADFGWGKPVYFGPVNVFPDGRAIIIPGSSGDSSVVVAICLQIASMQLFNKFFYGDISSFY